MDQLAMVSLLLFQFCGAKAVDYADHVVAAAKKYDLDSRVLVSMMRQESHCDPTATGRLGELGLMQIKRNTLATAGYDKLSDEELRNPALNIRLGARHLRRCLDKCGGAMAGALGMYSGLAKSKKTGQCRESKYSWAILARIAES